MKNISTKNKTWTPPQWPDDLLITTSSYDDRVRVDDAAQVFSDNDRQDMTGFFRYPEVYEHIIQRLLHTPGHKRILSLPASVGCEAYSLAAIFTEKAAQKPSPQDHGLEIHMADISQSKLEAAASGVYPYGFHGAILKPYAHHFKNVGRGTMSVAEDIKALVKPLPAFNILDRPEMGLKYDMVICLNLICYLPDLDSKVEAIGYLTSLTDQALCISHGTRKDYVQYHDDIDETLRGLGWSEERNFNQRLDYKDAQIYTPDPL